VYLKKWYGYSGLTQGAQCVPWGHTVSFLHSLICWSVNNDDDDDDDVLLYRRSPISVAAAAIFMASQASEDKKSQKGNFYFCI